MTASIETQIIAITQRLLESIAAGDWDTYSQLCDPTLTCFEPEGRGQLVEGMAFHKFYFDLGATRATRTTTIASPRVRMLGSAAVIAYVRLVQGLGVDGQPFTAVFEETRVWERQNGTWKHVHFHRSEPRPA